MKELEKGIKKIAGMLVSIFVVFLLVKKIMDTRQTDSNENIPQKSRGRSSKSMNKNTSVGKLEGLSQRQKKIYKIFDEMGNVHMDDVSLRIKNVHVRTLRRDLGKLADMKLIKKVGKTKNSYYVRT